TPQQGGLAAPVGAHDGGEVTGGNRHGEVLHDRAGAVVEPDVLGVQLVQAAHPRLLRSVASSQSREGAPITPVTIPTGISMLLSSCSPASPPARTTPLPTSRS